jgi:hypothetical protein
MVEEMISLSTRTKATVKTGGKLIDASRKLVALQRGLFETYRALMTGNVSKLDFNDVLSR